MRRTPVERCWGDRAQGGGWGNAAAVLVAAGLVAAAGYILLRGPAGGGWSGVFDEHGLELVDGAQGCPERGLLRLDYFYSPTCPACAQAGPVVERLAGELGPALALRKRCITVHGGDAALCTAEVGEEGFKEAESLAKAYAVRATPSLVFRCDRARAGAMGYDELRRLVCLEGEGLAGC